MRSYEVARSLYGFLTFLAVCAIVLGIAIAGTAAAATSAVGNFGSTGGALPIFMSLLPGAAVSFVGFLGLAMVQNGRATVDVAEYSQQMLQLARDQLEVSKQALGRPTLPASFSDGAKPAEPAFEQASPIATPTGTGAGNPTPGITTYNGRQIAKRGNEFLVDDLPFASLQDAKQHILANPR